MSVTSPVIPTTATGLSRYVLVPSPTVPNEFSPQQYAAPSDIPQVLLPPALMAVIAAGVTGAGTVRSSLNRVVLRPPVVPAVRGGVITAVTPAIARSIV
jgi:hypothetical protein